MTALPPGLNWLAQRHLTSLCPCPHALLAWLPLPLGASQQSRDETLQSTSSAPACSYLTGLACWVPLPPQMLPHCYGTADTANLSLAWEIPIAATAPNSAVMSLLQRNLYFIWPARTMIKPIAKPLCPKKSEKKVMLKLPHKKGKYHAKSPFSLSWITEKALYLIHLVWSFFVHLWTRQGEEKSC